MISIAITCRMICPERENDVEPALLDDLTRKTAKLNICYTQIPCLLESAPFADQST